MKEIKIAQLRISTWRRAKDLVRLRLFDLRDGSDWSVETAIIAGRKSGPMITVVAGQHGDEWNGIFIAHRLFEEIEHQDIEGTLVILPIANPYAFLQKSRISIMDQVDMNRSYGTDGERRPTSMAANTLFDEIFLKSSYVIDLHSGGPGDYIANTGVMEQGRFGLALHFNTGNVIVAHKDHGTLVAAAERNSIPAFSLQLGHAASIDYDACEKMLKGIMNFFRAVRLIPEPPQTDEGQQLFTDKKLLPAPDSGFVILNVGLGDDVEAGQNIGEIEPLFGTPIDVIAPESGRVLYARYEPIVSRGDSVIHLGRLGELKDRTSGRDLG
ncbi:MAG: succinylglutamate desuccinylase/aspartoacylase family protein [Actinomycetota bacterium]|nr:succinylglutamate desuccinylase/aspartoacylase family protein [Actinomycetota bacterium]